MIMDKTVLLAKANGVHIGAHPSLPDHQVRHLPMQLAQNLIYVYKGFGRREMAIEPVRCFLELWRNFRGIKTYYDVL